MTFKFYSLTLLAALTTAAAAQTATPAHHTTTHQATTAHHTAAPVSAIPRVHGIPHTLYALKYIDIVIGTGPLAKTHQWYTVRYTGWFPNGTKFDSSYDHPGGEPYVFPYGAHRVIYGWDTGFEGMHVGGKRRLFVPYQLAYGELGSPHMPAKADLIFDVELVAQSDSRPEPPQPPAPPTPKPSAEPEAKPAPDATPQPAAEPKPATPSPTPSPSQDTQPKTNPETH